MSSSPMIELLLTIGIAQLLIPLLLLFWQWRDRSVSKVEWLAKTVFSLVYLIAIAVAYFLEPVLYRI